MPRPRVSRPRRSRTTKRRTLKLSKFWPRATTRRRWWRWWRRLSAGPQFLLGLVLVAVTALTVNVVYQVVRKPTELFFPVSGTLYKSPSATWAEYAPIFRRHATKSISPEFLAALAQVEGSGNPVVRTYWRWSFASKPLDMYRPASSAVGMYQITDGTFAESRRYCVHDHVVVEEGPWNQPRSCWFNWLYFRVVPSHAVELTAAYLERGVASALAKAGNRSATLTERQNLAAVIHLCGAGAGAAYARRGLRFAPGQRCGDHDPREYVARVNGMKRVFSALSRENG
jgi:Transglycosylase SLT domain